MTGSGHIVAGQTVGRPLTSDSLVRRRLPCIAVRRRVLPGHPDRRRQSSGARSTAMQSRLHRSAPRCMAHLATCTASWPARGRPSSVLTTSPGVDDADGARPAVAGILTHRAEPRVDERHRGLLGDRPSTVDEARRRRSRPRPAGPPGPTAAPTQRCAACRHATREAPGDHDSRTSDPRGRDSGRGSGRRPPAHRRRSRRSPTGTRSSQRCSCHRIALTADRGPVSVWGDVRSGPRKLGLDLEGGTQIMLAARSPARQGARSTRASSTRRSTSSGSGSTACGVAEAEVATQGGQQHRRLAARQAGPEHGQTR